MRQMLYVSNTSRTVPAEQLNAILECARTNNARLGISGMLLYADGGFLQILEGEDGALDELYCRICADPRHWEQRVLLDHQSDPSFRGWSMGFDRVQPGMAEGDSAFSITGDAIAGRLSPGAGPVLVTMLRTFYRVQRDADLNLAVA